MPPRPLTNRRFVILGAVLVQLCLGAIYAWSVFTPALLSAGWSKTETQIVFSLGLASFAVVMVWAGKRLDTFGPRRLTIMGGLTLGAGYVLAGLLGATFFWPVAICIGLVGGAGIGLAYVVPIAVGIRWFPDKKGLVTGLSVAGFGFGAMGWIKLAGAWGGLIADFGLADTFIIYGVLFAGLVLLGAVWMVFPPEGLLPEGHTPPRDADPSGENGLRSAEMIKTPQFLLIFLTFAISAGVGLMTIGLMKIYPMEALKAAGLDEAAASAAAGTAMAVFFSLANGIGRIAWGVVSDKIGRRNAILIMVLTQAAVIPAFTSMAGTPALLYLGSALIGFNFGGNFALFPTITADAFGAKTVGENYPLVFLAYGVGGVAGPLLGGKLGDAGNFPLAFTICGVCLFAAAVLIFMAKPPRREA